MNPRALKQMTRGRSKIADFETTLFMEDSLALPMCESVESSVGRHHLGMSAEASSA